MNEALAKVGDFKVLGIIIHIHYFINKVKVGDNTTIIAKTYKIL